MGNSSYTIITTGTRFTPSTVFALASPDSVSLETGEMNRNRARNTSGAGVRTLRKDRTASARA